MRIINVGNNQYRNTSTYDKYVSWDLESLMRN